MDPVASTPDDELVQPILLAKGGTHTETILSAAKASLGSYLRPHYAQAPAHPNWQRWLAGRFTKSARRAPRSHLDKALEWAAGNGYPAGGHQFDDGAAVATCPMPYNAFPKVLAKAQVSGTDMPRDGAVIVANDGPTIHLLRSLTTGKAAAQAAHGLWLWALPHLEHPDGLLRAWFDAGMQVGLTLTGEEQLTERTREAVAVVRDAGLTEIAPGTVTAAITPPPWRIDVPL